MLAGSLNHTELWDQRRQHALFETPLAQDLGNLDHVY